jgi:hypothetical protein
MSSDHADEIVHRQLDTDADNPAGEVAVIVAELSDRDMEDLEPAWQVVDDILVHLFSDPPASDAQAEIAFTYEGYRVTIEQNGTGTFVDAS